MRFDSSEAIYLIKGDENSLHDDWVMIHEIKTMMDREWNIEVQVISRDSNHMADVLAKKGLDGALGLQFLSKETVLGIFSSSDVT